ncbi:MAG: MATE family efflux transporter [Bacteroidetes bacterium]|jgi:multidrug resistance protein, MATE family|nr:MATE family efflux transporter [Bacteroidota bacterium]MBT4399247.1 MATE family efflux transporter [Bacteroidota bacterium]MBT4409969.1 MATE family efflux transporter [Bacteroidota bacterium]MBT5425797.1 MATE family efflux transporter [Bacteroidota bacterium]MBT7463193.1 MATE family efflux transporter [Bacteroidota bacterium]
MNKKILRLAIPNIISNITIPLVGMVDLAILGHLESEIYIGAIAIGGLIFNVLYWGFGFLRMGTSGFTAQAYGKRDFSEVTALLGRALIVALGGAAFLIIMNGPIGWLSFKVINGSQEVEALAREYYNIRIFAAPATIGLYALTGWFIGMQNTRFPMIIAIVVNVLNLVFNLYFIYVAGMKSDGVAWGTLLAQYSGLILGIFLFWRYYRKLLKYWSTKVLLQVDAIKRFFLVNRDIFIRTLCLIFVFTFFTSQSAATDDTILAVNTILLQFFMLFSFVADGFAYAAEALIGRFIGAKNYKAMLRSIRLLFMWGLFISIPFTVAYAFWGDQFLFILTDNAKVIEASKPYLIWILFVPLAGFPSFLWDGIYIGATASKGMRNTMLIATFLVFVPVFFATRNSMENHGLWLALILFLVARGASQTFLAKKHIYTKAS